MSWNQRYAAEDHYKCNGTGVVWAKLTHNTGEYQLCDCPKGELLAQKHADPNCPQCRGHAVVPIYGALGRNYDDTDRRKICPCAEPGIRPGR